MHSAYFNSEHPVSNAAVPNSTKHANAAQITNLTVSCSISRPFVEADI
jgi:hypothetical protein